MNLNRFMEKGIGHVMKAAGRFYLSNKKGRAFLAGALPQMAQSARLRRQNESEGTHIPAFLIASVASQCNLHCAGCYARAGGTCGGTGEKADLSAAQWQDIFGQASSLGVSFILLAGGEPLTRRDVMEAAAAKKGIVFPVFTNGTLVDEDYLRLFDENRNLIPILSIEGEQAETDARRGVGTYEKVRETMARFEERGILFGASVTVTSENQGMVMKEDFLNGLRGQGCGMAVYVEYVPAEAGTDALTLDAEQLEQLNLKSAELKRKFGDMVILSFPGDEEAMGGCLASGRGFFHINPKGDAEPCPFSPYAKHNLKDIPVKQVLQDRYFEELREIAAEAGPHTGGCVLFQRQAQVQALLAR